MALAFALMLVRQIDLDIAHLRTGAQIILAHQSIEIDRRRRTYICLVVGHFRHGGQILANFAHGARSLLQRGTHRHVHHHLKFRFVVERQHFENHQFHHRQQHGHDDHAQYRQP